MIICIGMSYSIFFIFSLIGNLGEKYSFFLILHISILNSLQIFTYIPSHIFIISFCLFIMNLKNNNELIIVKEFLELNRLFLIISPILFLFIFIESNKNDFSSYIEKVKSNIINTNNINNTKIYISSEGDIKTYDFFIYSDENKITANKFLSYQIFNRSINKGELSTSLYLNDNNLYSRDSTIYENNDFRNENLKKKLFKNFNDIVSVKQTTIYKNKKNNLRSLYNVFQTIIFDFLFYACITIVFLSKKIVNRNLNLLRIGFLILFIFLYKIITPKIILNIFETSFQIISLLIFLLIFFNIKKYE